MAKDSEAHLYPSIEAYDTGWMATDDGHRIYYEQYGNPKGQPVLWFHGGPGGGIAPSHIRFFDPDFYRVVAFDQRGCGQSEPNVHSATTHDQLAAALANNTTDRVAQDASALLKYLAVEGPVGVFGGSWGSTIGAYFAEKYPEKCSWLVLRGIYTARPREVLWKGGFTVADDETGDLIFRYGKQILRHKAYARWMAEGKHLLYEVGVHIPPGAGERDRLIAAGVNPILTYYYLLTHKLVVNQFPEIRKAAAFALYQYENSSKSAEGEELFESFDDIPQARQAKAMDMPTLEMHYFVRFLAREELEDELLDISIGRRERFKSKVRYEYLKLRNAMDVLGIHPESPSLVRKADRLTMPVTLVHGKMDNVTFFKRACDLHEAIVPHNANVTFITPEKAGHDAMDPDNRQALRQAVDGYRELYQAPARQKTR